IFANQSKGSVGSDPKYLLIKSNSSHSGSSLSLLGPDFPSASSRLSGRPLMAGSCWQTYNFGPPSVPCILPLHPVVSRNLETMIAAPVGIGIRNGRGTFANGDCTQCAHVGAAIPQLVTYVPLVTGGRSRSRNPLLAPPPSQLLRQPLHSYGRRWLFSSGEAFYSRNSSTSMTRTTENTVRKDKLTFDLCKTSDEDTRFTKVEHILRASAKD
ncbi:Uncharacterized protein DBV15_06121, partial [Temnothorax longispinosus]